MAHGRIPIGPGLTRPACGPARCIQALVALVLAGCTIAMPLVNRDVSTPVDTGLAGAGGKTAVVRPFDTSLDASWGMYAARLLADELSAAHAFREVRVSARDDAGCAYVVRGSLDHLHYGGTEESTRVFVRVSVERSGGPGPCFVRVVKASVEEAAFHLTRLCRVDPPSPPIEDVLGSVLADTARDIARRTSLPAVEDP